MKTRDTVTSIFLSLPFLRVLSILMLVGAPSASAQNPAVGLEALAPDTVGAEIQVNSYTTDHQTYPEIAESADSFVVVWQDSSDQEGGGFSVRGRRFLPDGTPIADEFPVNTYTTGAQSRPSVAMAGNGAFVVVWDGEGSGDDQGIHAQRFDASGVAQGAEFQVNDAAPFGQSSPRVAADTNGNFVVVWQEFYNIRGRRFDSLGVAQGTEFQVNTAAYEDNFPAVDMNASGAFVVVWQRVTAKKGSTIAIMAKRYAADGTELGGQFQVSDSSTYQYFPDVGLDAEGDFVVAWEDASSFDEDVHIRARRFSADGTMLATEFQVDSATSGYQAEPSVGVRPDGFFTIAWQSDAGSADIVARRYQPDGTTLGDEFIVNTYTTARDLVPALAGGAADALITTWQSGEVEGFEDGADGSGSGIRAQVFAFCSGADPADDSDGDGTFDVCDLCQGDDLTGDSDEDGVCDDIDACPDFDDGEDEDKDGVPDGCDLCAGFDDTVDTDEDGVPNGCDVCEGFDDSEDSDDDGIPDGCDDTTPPEVVLVNSTPDTGDGELSECEEARITLASLHLLFSEPLSSMKPERGLVVAPDYLVVAPGTNASLDTMSCAAIDPGDEIIPITSLVHSAATTDLELPLRDGLQYRLFACDTLEDLAGNHLENDFVRDFRIETTNLFVNGQFDCDLSGWQTSASRGGSGISHGSDDVDSASASGSALFTGASASGLGLHQCVDLGPSRGTAQNYDLHSSLRAVGEASAEALVSRSCDFFAAAGCAGDPVGSFATADQILLATAGAWLTLEDRFAVPPTAVAAECRLVVADPDIADGTLMVSVDDLSFSAAADVATEILFTDGFESGNTSAWSSVEP